MKTPGFADAALRHTAELWFFVAVLGQCAFLYRVVAQYGVATVSGHFEDWLATVLVLGVVTAYMCVGTVAYTMWVLRRHG